MFDRPDHPDNLQGLDLSRRTKLRIALPLRVDCVRHSAFARLCPSLGYSERRPYYLEQAIRALASSENSLLETQTYSIS